MNCLIRCIVLVNPHCIGTLGSVDIFMTNVMFMFNRFREHSGTSPKQQLLFLFSFQCYAIKRKASEKSFSSCVVDAMCELIRPVESMISYKYTNVLNLLLPEVRLRSEDALKLLPNDRMSMQLPLFFVIMDSCCLLLLVSEFHQVYQLMLGQGLSVLP